MSDAQEKERKAAGKDSPHLEEHEKKQAAAAQPLGPRVIHEVLREEGEVELRRTVGALLWSGLAAGMSMGFSFLTEAFLKKTLHGSVTAEAVAPFGYSVGFLIAVLGKQQLFTETTLTATLPLMYSPSLAGFGRLVRMWTAVLVSNVVGTFIFAYLVSRPGLLSQDTVHALSETADGAFSEGFVTGMTKAMFSGWLIALIVWLMPPSKTAAPFVIAALTYVVALAGFPHIIAGSTEAAYAVFSGAKSWSDYVQHFFAPTILGNVIGGVALAALLNHAPVAHDIAARQEEGA